MINTKVGKGSGNVFLTVYTIAYNEELMLPFMIKWYRERFPSCHIVVYDNESTDKTVNIALEHGCEVLKHDSNNEIRDDLYLEIKNNCWKSARTDWVLICDVDELLDINQEQLIEEESKGVTVISSKGWNMINMEVNKVGLDCKYGKVSAPQYSKNVLFNKAFIREVRYTAGCHTNSFLGAIKQSEALYDLFHYKFIGEQYTIDRHKEFAARLSKLNLSRKEGIHYLNSEQEIRNQYQGMRDIVNKKLDKEFNW